MALNPMTPAGILAPTLFHKTRMEYQPHLRHCRHYYTDLRFFMLGFINHTLEKKKPPSVRLVTSVAVFVVFLAPTFSLIFSEGSLTLKSLN